MSLTDKIKNLLIILTLSVTVLLPSQVLAQANYSCDTYGAGAYQDNTCLTSDPDNGGSKGRLSDTGKSILLFGGIGLIGIIGGSLLLFVTIKSKRKAKEIQGPKQN